MAPQRWKWRLMSGRGHVATAVLGLTEQEETAHGEAMTSRQNHGVLALELVQYKLLIQLSHRQRRR